MEYNLYYYVFLAVIDLHCYTGFSSVAASGATLQLWCVGFSLWWPFLLSSVDSGARGL